MHKYTIKCLHKSVQDKVVTNKFSLTTQLATWAMRPSVTVQLFYPFVINLPLCWCGSLRLQRGLDALHLEGGHTFIFHEHGDSSSFVLEQRQLNSDNLFPIQWIFCSEMFIKWISEFTLSSNVEPEHFAKLLSKLGRVLSFWILLISDVHPVVSTRMLTCKMKFTLMNSKFSKSRCFQLFGLHTRMGAINETTYGEANTYSLRSHSLNNFMKSNVKWFFKLTSQFYPTLERLCASDIQNFGPFDVVVNYCRWNPSFTPMLQ